MAEQRYFEYKEEEEEEAKYKLLNYSKPQIGYEFGVVMAAPDHDRKVWLEVWKFGRSTKEGPPLFGMDYVLRLPHKYTV